MSNTYLTMKEKHQKDINNFPIFFAFSNSQFEEGMKKFNLQLSDKDKILSIGGGGFIKKIDSEKFSNMFKSHDEEMKQARLDETFIYDMFYYELSNHEYTYTGYTGQTLEALGLTVEEIDNNPLLANGLKKACKAQWEWNEKHN